MSKMKAPEGVSMAAVENDQYEVVDGHIEVSNGEHIPILRLHGFEEVPDEDGLTFSEKLPEERVQPDFSRFVNREALVDYLVAHGDSSHKSDERRADLEAACVACFASGAERVQLEAQGLSEGEAEEGEKESEEQAEQDELEKSDEE